MVLRVTTANHYTIRRSKVSSFVIFYNTDRLLKTNGRDVYTDIQIPSVYWENRACTNSVYQALSLYGRGLASEYEAS